MKRYVFRMTESICKVYSLLIFSLKLNLHFHVYLRFTGFFLFLFFLQTEMKKFLVEQGADTTLVNSGAKTISFCVRFVSNF